MEHPARMSLKQRARGKHLSSPESIQVGDSAPRLNILARATSDMVGAVLFPDQDIPALYWRTYGTEQFDGHFFTLGGPLSEGVVKSVLIVTTKQTLCLFTSGWLEFCYRNHLKLGDTLLFVKTSPATFEVSKKVPRKFLFV